MGIPQNSGKTAARRSGRPFRKGQSGNPGGRPKSLGNYVREKCGERGEKLIDALWLIAFGSNEQRRAFFGETVKVTTRDRRECVSELCDRGFGRPPQALEVTGTDGEPIAVHHHYATSAPTARPPRRPE